METFLKTNNRKNSETRKVRAPLFLHNESPIQTVLFHHYRMYRAFADCKFLCCRANGCFILHDVFAEDLTPLFR